jgi:hypothetical protein
VHPPALKSPADFKIPKLPSEVTVERAYADMMAYLMKHTQEYVEKSSNDGMQIWSRLRSKMVIVLATPNSWYTTQHALLRKAAVRAGLVTEQTASELLEFINEAEASVHYALYYRPTGWLQKGTTFGIIDAGGSTVDTTVYKCTSTSPLELKALADDCIQVRIFSETGTGTRQLNSILGGRDLRKSRTGQNTGKKVTGFPAGR